MDEMDRLLLEELQSQGMQRSEALAARLGLGGRTVRRRLSEMKKRRLFRTVPIPNRVALGHRAWARIGVKAWPNRSDNVAKALVDHPLVCSVASSFGSFDFIIDVQIGTFEELAHFVNAELTQFEGIQDTETMILMSPRKYFGYSWPEPKRNEKCKYCNNTIIRKAGIDDTDRRIIDVVVHEGILPLPQLQSKLGMSQGTIRKHLKEMINQGAIKIEIISAPLVLGSEVAATIGIVVNDCPAHSVIDRIVDHPAVYLASTSISRFNVILEVRFKNMDSLTGFLDKELTQIPGVNRVEPFLHTRLLKFYTIK